MNKQELAKMIDHTLLKPYATDLDFQNFCQEAIEMNVAMVAVNSGAVKICKQILGNTSIHVGAAISFPLGQTNLSVKIFEVANAIKDGADEIDYVINIGKAKMHDWSYIETEMQEIVNLCSNNNVISKVILETCYLDKDEIIQICKIAKKVKPHYVKTSTGFGKSGATIEDVKLMKSVIGEDVKIKAAGGIRDTVTCLQMIEAGASRIGTSSTRSILNELE